MYNLPTPRPFQLNALNNIMANKPANIILNAPTGGGKSILALYIIKHALSENKRVLFLVDRITLIKQISDTANYYGLSHNLIQGRNCVTQSGLNFTIASIQTFFSKKSTPTPFFDMVLVDEAHSQYAKLTDYIKTSGSQIIGLSATPYTIGLGNVYNSVMNCTTANKLTQDGTLVPLKAYTFRKIDMMGAKTVGGEWTGKEVEARSAQIYGDVVSTYKAHANGIRSICFCATVSHCHEVAKQFIQAGVSVGVFTGDVSDSERAILLDDFDNNRISILISVSALSKGFDKPYVGCILDMRPLRRSLAEYIQMIGRGLRSCEGKTKCLLFDFTGNVDRFWDDYEDVFYNGVDSLDCSERLNRVRPDKPTAKGIEYKECPDCGYNRVASKCVKCGYVLPAKHAITVSKADVRLEKVIARNNAKIQKLRDDLAKKRASIPQKLSLREKIGKWFSL